MNYFKNKKGSMTVELALVFLALLLMIIPIADLSERLTDSQRVTAAIRLGAQYATLNPNDTNNVKQVVLNNITNLDQNNLNVSVNQFCECASVVALCTASCPSGSMQKFTSINTNYTGNYLFNYPAFGSTYNINKTISIRVN